VSVSTLGRELFLVVSSTGSDCGVLGRVIKKDLSFLVLPLHGWRSHGGGGGGHAPNR